MFFTQDDYRKIEEWLRTRTMKDSEFPHAAPLRGNENVPIIQDGKNRTLTIDELVKQVAMMELPDFFNVTTFTKKGSLFLEEAINCIPVEQRKLGLTITFHSAKGHWLIYQFKGTSLNQWSALNYWRSPIEEALEELVLYPDEEDTIGVRDGNRTFLKFKDKDYDPADFSGMGRIMLRKNLVGTEACSLDDEDHLLNVLTQDMIREENTVYIIQYDFDLNGKVISIPKGCTLWFQGGSINNGTIYLQETAILGAFEFADMGNIKLFGKFNTGQIMTFSDDSYKAKTEGYFVAGTKPSSATVEEDAKNERETFYDKNPDAYTTQKRQELRWWNGEEWVLILDITDYNEIKSIISDLIEKHNTEISACYRYFKTRCYTLESCVSNIKETTVNILEQIAILSNTINNIDNIIIEQIENYITGNVIGVTSITVNGQRYSPDEMGNITLPDYEDTDTTKEPLTIVQGGNTLGIYDGTEPKIINISESLDGGTADKVANKLKFTGAVSAEYDGSTEVTVNIPMEGGQTSDLKKLHIKTNYNDDRSPLPSGVVDTTFYGSLIPYDIDLLREEGTIDLTKVNFGSPTHPIILYSANIYRADNNSPWQSYITCKHPFITAVISLEDCAVKIDLNNMGTNTMAINSAIASFSKSTVKPLGTETTGGRYRSNVIGLRCHVAGKTVYIQGVRTADNNNDSLNFDPAAKGGGLLGFNIIIVGYIVV